VNLHLVHSGLTDTGRVRAGNEDAWAVDPAQGLYIVADGMGGHNAGEIAARAVVESLPEMVRRRVSRGRQGAATGKGLARRLRTAVARLSRDVYLRAMAEPSLYGMGATVVLAMVQRDSAVVVHMGDSRAYLLHDGQLGLVTKDHSVVQELLDRGHITADEAATHPARNRITASVGMPGDPTPACNRVTLAAGDKLMLCTDGLAGMIPDEQIGQILARPEPPADLCQRLVDAANEAGGYDNVTVVVIEVCSGAEECGGPECAGGAGENNATSETRAS
jgi:serine/threonine protein phosphatase PrpC